jgi:hypothetical protein
VERDARSEWRYLESGYDIRLIKEAISRNLKPSSFGIKRRLRFIEVGAQQTSRPTFHEQAKRVKDMPSERGNFRSRIT